MLVKIRILSSYWDWIKTFISFHLLKMLIGDSAKMRKNNAYIFGLLICLFLSNYAFNSNFSLSSKIILERNHFDFDTQDSNNIKFNPKLAQVSGNFSNYNLSVIMDESKSMVEGNLTVDFYNNDNVNFTQIYFHIYLSGMYYIARQGKIEIVNVTDVINPNISFPFNV